MATYTELVDNIHLYTNRDQKVISYSLVKQFIDHSANEIYNKLRVPPLEGILTYAAATQAGNLIPIPEDAIEFIQFRKLDATNRVDSIYESRADIKSFYLSNTNKFNDHYYTREATDLVVYPDFAAGDKFQLVYYRRLPAMYSRHVVNKANFDAGYVYYSAVSQADLESTVEAAEPLASTKDTDLVGTIISVTSPDADYPELATGWYIGKLSANWLRDAQQNLVLHGALAEAYGYLHDTEKQERYLNLFREGIADENKEAVVRTVRGGSAQSHYSSTLLQVIK